MTVVFEGEVKPTMTTRQQMRMIVKQQDDDFRIALRKQSVAVTDGLSDTLKSVVKNSCAHAVLDRSAKAFVKNADPTIARMEDMLKQMCHAAQILCDALVFLISSFFMEVFILL